MYVYDLVLLDVVMSSPDITIATPPAPAVVQNDDVSGVDTGNHVLSHVAYLVIDGDSITGGYPTDE